MQLNITITKKNKDKVFKLIDTILEDETDGFKEENKIAISEETKNPVNSEINYLRKPEDIPNLKNGKIVVYEKDFILENKRINSVGSWGQFNSFFPIKASLRILANNMKQHNTSSVRLDDFIKICEDQFQKKNYHDLRGFPSSKKDTAWGRFVWHFLTTAYEMGLIVIKESKLDYEGMPGTLLDWDKVMIAITKEGLEFAKMPNNIFDNKDKQKELTTDDQILTNDEKKWIISFLKRINDNGYREYNFLFDIYKFLTSKHDGSIGTRELQHWFQNNVEFIDYIKSWSRKAESIDERGLKEQVYNLSVTFASSKIALLRELSVVKNKRSDYSIIGNMEGG